MSYSTLRESSLYVNFLIDWIEKDFKKWFVYKILIDESIEEEKEEEKEEEEEESFELEGGKEFVSVKDTDSRLGKVFNRRLCIIIIIL